jgi:hypothetical protein
MDDGDHIANLQAVLLSLYVSPQYPCFEQHKLSGHFGLSEPNLWHSGLQSIRDEQ